MHPQIQYSVAAIALNMFKIISIKTFYGSQHNWKNCKKHHHKVSKYNDQRIVILINCDKMDLMK